MNHKNYSKNRWTYLISPGDQFSIKIRRSIQKNNASSVVYFEFPLLLHDHKVPTLLYKVSKTQRRWNRAVISFLIPRHSFMFRSFRLCSALSVVVSANSDIIRYVYWCRWTEWSSLSVVSVTALWQLYDIYKTIRHLMITQVLLFWMKQEIPQGRLWHTCTGNVNLCLHR